MTTRFLTNIYLLFFAASLGATPVLAADSSSGNGTVPCPKIIGNKAAKNYFTWKKKNLDTFPFECFRTKKQAKKAGYAVGSSSQIASADELNGRWKLEELRLESDSCGDSKSVEGGASLFFDVLAKEVGLNAKPFPDPSERLYVGNVTDSGFIIMTQVDTFVDFCPAGSGISTFIAELSQISGDTAKKVRYTRSKTCKISTITDVSCASVWVGIGQRMATEP